MFLCVGVGVGLEWAQVQWRLRPRCPLERAHRLKDPVSRWRSACCRARRGGRRKRMPTRGRYLDVAAVLGAVVGVFVLTNSNHPGAASIAGFLNMRVTIKNLLLLAGVRCGAARGA